MDTYKTRSSRRRMVIKMLNTTIAKLISTIISTGQGNSAYSLPWVCPVEIPIMPAATVIFQKMALKTPSL